MKVCFLKSFWHAQVLLTVSTFYVQIQEEQEDVKVFHGRTSRHVLLTVSVCYVQIQEESKKVWKFIIDREIEAPARFQAIQSYR